MMNVCPLGLSRTEEDCPRAPCVRCLRQMGERLLADIQRIHAHERDTLHRLRKALQRQETSMLVPMDA